ncbi:MULTISPECIES: hypothetical protein [Clostridium]|jgi:hypothetical protein|uniref:Spo0E family sporulation regulatory protein-aspartic acid phosphatase n=2 Tax=Clostridium intestinale TaxID=36845 RepID=A0A7D6ZVQ8_9CLOT|nr:MULTISPECIES: hypothetical protein [Clostridium]QLY78554.1 hypothetical protein HZF06_15865 [Clostridium intestinale]WRY53644.1 hypothetical protein P8F83_10620 [Clostridium intestinale]SHI64303.1 hypothetical protein SAMN02745941_04116 [Clostridium intestinale DSM 6191]
MGKKEEIEVMREILNKLIININFLNKSDRDILQEISEKMDKLIVDYLQESKIE